MEQCSCTCSAEEGRRFCWCVYPDMISQPVSGSGLCTIKAGAAEETGSILCMIQPPSGCPGPVIRLLSVAALGLTGGWCMSSTVVELQQPMQLDLGLPQDCILHCERRQFHQWFKLFKVLSKGTGGQNRLKCMKIQNPSTVLFHCQSYYNPVVTLIFHLVNGASIRDRLWKGDGVLSYWWRTSTVGQRV